MSDSWHSPQKIHTLGHAALKELLQDPVLVEEKIDGSYCAWGAFNGELRVRSKGATLNIFAPDNMFKCAVEVIQTLPLHDGWTYRAEYLRTPRHNALAYDRIPKNHLIVFDICTGHEEYMPYERKVEEAARIGLEVVPRLYEGRVDDLNLFRQLLDTTSVLGGQKVEGVVVKNYARFGTDGKALMGKFVSEAFKEVHAREWKRDNPTQGDILQRLVEEYRTPARWNKAIQHLAERGELENSPRDIGKLIPEISKDIEEECRIEIRDKLFVWAWPHIRRGVINGFPEFYKDELLKEQFNG